MYVAALRGMIKSKAKNVPEEQEVQMLKFKPCDVVDFMVQRAKVEPLAFCVLLELRFAEVIFMLHQCEKQSKNELFLASMKLLLPIYASSHAIKYVSMVSDFLIDWYCMSEAERIIFAKAVLTKKTKNSCTIFTDRFVEWMMRDMRMWLGKHAGPHHHKLVEQVALSLNERKKRKSEGAKPNTKKASSSPIKELEINRVFCESLIFAEETNLWGPGEIELFCPSSQKSDRPMQKPFKSFKGVPLNTDILFCVSTGTKRAKDYFQVNLVDGDWNDPKRSEKESEGGVSLKKIETTLAENEKEVSLDLKRIFFLKLEEIKGSYTLVELKDEFKFLNSELQKKGLKEVERDNRLYKTWTKAAYASCISAARLKLLDADSKWIENRKNDLWEKNDMRRMSKDREYQRKVEDELRNKFFSLQNTQKYIECNANVDDSHCYHFKLKNYVADVNEKTDGIVFADSDTDDEQQQAQRKQRDSMGGTDFFSVMGSPF